MNVLKRSAVALASVGLGLSALVATAGPAHAGTIVNGHYDLVLAPVCTDDGKITGGGFTVDGGSYNPATDEFVFGAGTLHLGFEVDWGADEDCSPTTVRVDLASATGTGSATTGSGGSTVTNYSWTPAASPNPLVITTHGDPDAWIPTSASALTFTFTPTTGGSAVTSTSVPLNIR